MNKDEKIRYESCDGYMIEDKNGKVFSLTLFKEYDQIITNSIYLRVLGSIGFSSWKNIKKSLYITELFIKNRSGIVVWLKIKLRPIIEH